MGLGVGLGSSAHARVGVGAGLAVGVGDGGVPHLHGSENNKYVHRSLNWVTEGLLRASTLNLQNGVRAYVKHCEGHSVESCIFCM